MQDLSMSFCLTLLSGVNFLINFPAGFITANLLPHYFELALSSTQPVNTC